MGVHIRPYPFICLYVLLLSWLAYPNWWAEGLILAAVQICQTRGRVKADSRCQVNTRIWHLINRYGAYAVRVKMSNKEAVKYDHHVICLQVKAKQTNKKHFKKNI